MRSSLKRSKMFFLQKFYSKQLEFVSIWFYLTKLENEKSVTTITELRNR